MDESEQETLRRQADIVIVRLEQQMGDVVKIVNDIKSWLMGDGTASNPGIMIRLDRLERSEIDRIDSERNRRNQRMGIYGSLMLLAIERLWHYVTVLLKGATQ